MKTFSVFECHLFMIHYVSIFFENNTPQVKYGNKSGLVKSKAPHKTKCGQAVKRARSAFLLSMMFKSFTF
jgi:hypothetical protein